MITSSAVSPKGAAYDYDESRGGTTMIEQGKKMKKKREGGD
jgi:hypothetical protein